MKGNLTMTPDEARVVLLSEAGVIQASLPDSGIKKQFDPLMLLTLIVPILIEMFKGCRGNAEQVRRIAADRPTYARGVVFSYAKDHIAAAYSIWGRLWFAGRIRTEALELASQIAQRGASLNSSALAQVIEAAHVAEV